MSRLSVRADGLGKQFWLRAPGGARGSSLFRYKSFRETISELAASPFRRGASRPVPDDLFWALKDLSFEVHEGETLGIIGRNGAGKSTLLKILSRITDPTEGEAEIFGRVGSLLEVGTGFHPELTGRENIFLNGAILGMKRAEIASKFDEIVSFSEIESFLDMPVKHYSSGMYMRLAFAVAAHLDPEILIIDEVLAVGDAQFQKKCLGKMSDVATRGRTVLFVSHNMQAVRQLCARAILLEGGRIVHSGPSAEVVDRYMAGVTASNGVHTLSESIAALPPDPIFKLRDIRVLQEGRPLTDIVSGKPLVLEIEYQVLQDSVGFHVYFELRDAEGLLLFESIHNGDEADIPQMSAGHYLSRATLPADFLAPTSYELSVDAGVHRIRHCLPKPIKIPLTVSGLGRVNRAYPGYRTAGRLAPLIEWRTSREGTA